MPSSIQPCARAASPRRRTARPASAGSAGSLRSVTKSGNELLPDLAGEERAALVGAPRFICADDEGEQLVDRRRLEDDGVLPGASGFALRRSGRALSIAARRERRRRRDRPRDAPRGRPSPSPSRRRVRAVTVYARARLAMRARRARRRRDRVLVGRRARRSRRSHLRRVARAIARAAIAARSAGPAPRARRRTRSGRSRTSARRAAASSRDPRARASPSRSRARRARARLASSGWFVDVVACALAERDVDRDRASRPTRPTVVISFRAKRRSPRRDGERRPRLGVRLTVAASPRRPRSRARAWRALRMLGRS